MNVRDDPDDDARLRLSMAGRVVEELHDATIEELHYDPQRLKVPPASTRPLSPLWFAIAELCSVTPRDAANFIEMQGAEMLLPTIYPPNRAGLFSPLADDTARAAWIGAYEAAGHVNWDRAWCAENLDFLRLSSDEADRIMLAAGLAYGAPPDDAQEPHAGLVPPYMNPAHPRYAPQLAAAVSAWLAVGNPPPGKTPKQALTAWLSKHGARFGLTRDDGGPVNEAVSRCATVANWRPSGGAPKTPGA